MRKIILNLAISIDGFIEGPNGNYDWCFTDQDYGMGAFYETVEVIFMGRKSYELISADTTTFADKKIYVFSDTLTSTAHLNAQIVAKNHFKQKVEEVRLQNGGNIWLFGGATLVSSFITERLINILMLSVHPVILGTGKRLFDGVNEQTELLLLEHQSFSSGLMQLKYALKPQFDYSIIGL